MDSFPKNLLTTKDAGKLSGYTSDYLARLTRSGEIIGQKIGHSWFVDRSSLEVFLEKQKNHNINRAEELMHLRSKEYRAHNEGIKQLETSFIHNKTNNFKQHISDPGIRQPASYSKAFSILIAFIVVLAGAAFSRSVEISQLADNTLDVAQEFSSGFNEIFSAVPVHIASSISSMNTQMSLYSLHISDDSILRLATTNVLIASPVLAAPRFPNVGSMKFSNAKITEDTSKSMNEKFNQASLTLNFMTFGNVAIVFSHAAIQEYVTGIYNFVAFAPEISRSTTTLLGTTGATIASNTSQIPNFFVRLYSGTIAAPGYFAPKIARAVFSTEFMLVKPAVSFSNVVSEQYLTLVEDTGNLLYGSVESTIAFSTGLARPLGVIGDLYRGLINRVAIAVNSTDAMMLSVTASSNSLAAVLPAFTAGGKVVTFVSENIGKLLNIHTPLPTITIPENP